MELYTEEWRNMNSKHFGLQVIFRLILITIGIYGAVYYGFIEINYIRIFFLTIAVILALVELFHYLNKANKDTTNFLQSIIHNDFTLKYSSDNKGDSFTNLYNKFNEVNEKFLAASQSEATEYHYLSTLIHQLNIGILSFDKNGRVSLANNGIKQLLGKSEIINLESIKSVNETLYNTINRLESGASEVLKVKLQTQVYHLAISASLFKLRGQSYKLVSFQDIRGELDQNEMAAWQKLIRVLTHEIMNSVAPITSLSGTLNEMVSTSQKTNTPLDSSQLSSLNDGLDAIENRSNGLMNFTEAYRSLTRIPLPNITSVDGRLYFQRINSLFIPTLASTSISFQLQLPKHDIKLEIDPDLMEQVFINLLKNAKEAIIENEVSDGQIILKMQQSNPTIITISDNGGGISSEVIDNIFIPFFTTKNTGSGVGLSLVKQIVQLHKGDIDIASNKNQKSTTIKITL